MNCTSHSHVISYITLFRAVTVDEDAHYFVLSRMLSGFSV